MGLVVLSGVVLSCVVACKASREDPHKNDSSVGHVELTVDFQGKADNITVDVACRSGTTVFDLLVAASAAHSFEFESRGAGELTFVESIGGISNSGGVGDNWIYHVNGSLGNQSCALHTLRPGDRVLWRYGEYK